MTTEPSNRSGVGADADLQRLVVSEPRRNRRRLQLLPVLAVVLLGCGLVGCSVTNDNLWPSIASPQTTSRGTGSSQQRGAGAGPAVAAGLTQPNVWDVAGGAALLIACGGVLALLWRLLAMNRRFDNLRSTYETLASRRDKGATDVMELSLKVSALNQQIQSLQGEIARRPEPPVEASGGGPSAAAAVLTPPQQPQPPAPPQPKVPPPAPMIHNAPSAGNGLGSGSSGNGAAPAPVLHGAAIRTAEPLQQAVVRAPESLADAERQPVAVPPVVVPPAAVPPVAVPSVAAPPPAPSLPSLTNTDTELARAAAPKRAITLADLVDAINGEGRRPVVGINFVELDFADPPDETLLRPGLPPPTRLRRVTGSGMFLLVMFEGDDWLFPGVATLQTADPELSRRGLFELRKSKVERPKLKFPAQMREVGGLWEVTDSGQILVPA